MGAGGGLGCPCLSPEVLGGWRYWPGFGEPGPASRGVSELRRAVSLPVALKFPLKCFFLFFKEKKYSQTGKQRKSTSPKSHETHIRGLAGFHGNQEARLNPVCRRRVGWDPAAQGPGPPRLPPGQRRESRCPQLRPSAPTPPCPHGPASGGGGGGGLSSGEALGDPRAGPSRRTCRAAAHTVPPCGVKTQPTLTLRNMEAPVPGQRGGTGLMPACRRVGARVDRTLPLLPPPPVPHAHIQPDRLCAEVRGVGVFARTRAEFSKKAENIYRFSS